MFKKRPSTKQFDMFNSPSSMMCDRESRYYDDPFNWHMKFYEEITSKIDETIFKTLFKEGNEGGKIDKKRGRKPKCVVRMEDKNSLIAKYL